VGFQNIGQATDIQCVYTVFVQAFQQVTTQCFLGMVAATGALAVQPPDTIATVLTVFEFRL